MGTRGRRCPLAMDPFAHAGVKRARYGYRPGMADPPTQAPTPHDPGISSLARARRRLLATGAVAGLLVGVVGVLAATGSVATDLAGIARIAVVVPVVIYLAWWLLSPGLSDDVDGDLDAATDVEAAATGIVASVFDHGASPDTYAVSRPQGGGGSVGFAGRIAHPAGTVPRELRPAFRRRAAGGEHGFHGLVERDVAEGR